MKKNVITGNFGSIGLVASRKPKPPSGLASIPPEVSYCGRRAYLNRNDVPGAKACRKCGNYHQPTEGK